ncbi:MAG: VWA domain-containing protein [Pseudomonadota bacterium]
MSLFDLSTLSAFHFLRPWVLLALLLLPALYWLGRRAQAQRGAWARLVDPALQRFVLTTSVDGETRRRWPAYWLTGLLIVALAGPAWEQLPQPVFTQQHPVVIALDLSQSMTAQDILPTRLQVAKIKLRDVLRQRRDGQTALVAFAGDAFLVTPLTDDTRTIVSMLPSLTPRTMPSQGSRLAPPIQMATRLLDQAGGEPGEIVVITDGVSDESDARTASREAREVGHRVSLIAVGTAQGGLVRDTRGEFLRDRRGEMVMASVNRALLEDIAADGGGTLFDTTLSDAEIESLLSRPLGDYSAALNEQQFATDLWHEQGPLLVLLCLPFVALWFRRGTLFCAVLASVLLTPPPAQAGLWDDLWERPDQQGQTAFDDERYARASSLFEHQRWKAASLYRAQEYAQSAEALSGLDTPADNYNRGNALAKAQNIDDAIKAYERTLTQQPDHDDARFNLELLKQLQDSQENEQEQQEDGEESSDGDQSDGESQDNGDGQDSDADSGESQDGEPEGEQNEEPKNAESQTEEEREAEQREMQAQLSEQMTEEEQQQAVEQWLQRIPDDPGGLLRRKFKRQYRDRGEPRRSGEQW